jgi:hypothetical protein
MQLGPIRFAVNSKSQAALRPFAHSLVVRETSFKTSCEGPASIQELYAALAADAKRNQLVLDDVIGALEQGRSPILLTERKDHLEYFAAQLSRIARHVVVLQGGMSPSARREVKRQLAAVAGRRGASSSWRPAVTSAKASTTRGLIRSSSALPVSWKGNTDSVRGPAPPSSIRQSRRSSIFDYVDREVPVLWRMFQKRLRGYRGLGYARGEAPLGFGNAGSDLIVEYNEETLRALKERDDFLL